MTRGGRMLDLVAIDPTETLDRDVVSPAPRFGAMQML